MDRRQARGLRDTLPRGLQGGGGHQRKAGQWDGPWETVGLEEGPEVTDCAPFPRIHLPGEKTNGAFTPNLFVWALPWQ